MISMTSLLALTTLGGAAAALTGAPLPQEPEAPKRVVVLGIDGMDPDLLDEVIERFPDRTEHFQWLKAQGGVHSLGTSVPPQSPVAWSNFITGRNPGGHGIYDFIHRDPTTRALVPGNVVMGETSQVDLFGDWKFPLGGDSDTNRTGESFWVTLAKAGIPADIWRMPANFPVEPAKGLSFPGMMTPALDSAYGSYTILTTNPPVDTQRSGGKFVQVVERGGVLRANLVGPPNAFKQGDPAAQAELKIYVDSESNAAAITAGSEVVILKPGEWSDFITLEFELLPAGMMNMTGIVRFYLRSIEPEFELYASPVNIDPVTPVMSVAEPQSASSELVDAIGYYYTQGMAEEVNALKDDATPQHIDLPDD